MRLRVAVSDTVSDTAGTASTAGGGGALIRHGLETTDRDPLIALANGNAYVTIMSVAIEVKELLLDDGSSPFAEWFDSLEAQGAAKVAVAVARIEQGNLSNVEWFRGIGEYKIDWGPGLRIYLAREGLTIIVLIGGGTKRRQQHDIDRAVASWEDYKRRRARMA